MMLFLSADDSGLVFRSTVCVCVGCGLLREREGAENKCVCVCVCVCVGCGLLREREGAENKCVCVCMCVCV